MNIWMAYIKQIYTAFIQASGLKPRKFKGGICCGGHLVVTYGAELLYLRIFSFPSSVSNQ